MKITVMQLIKNKQINNSPVKQRNMVNMGKLLIPNKIKWKITPNSNNNLINNKQYHNKWNRYNHNNK